MDVFYWIAVAAVTITSSARITRLVTYDKFPPVEWLRDKYADATDGSGWQLLAFCAYCASFWVTLAVVLVGYYTDFHEAWWLVNAIFGGSYLAAILMVHDGDNDEEPTVEFNQTVLGQVSDLRDSDFPVIENTSEDED